MKCWNQGLPVAWAGMKSHNDLFERLHRSDHLILDTTMNQLSYLVLASTLSLAVTHAIAHEVPARSTTMTAPDECQVYLSTVQVCLNQIAGSEAEREKFSQQIQQAAKAWQQFPNDDETHAQLKEVCESTHKAFRSSAASMGCSLPPNPNYDGTESTDAKPED